MKKIKILCFLLSIIVLGLAGCSSSDTSPILDEILPWSLENSTCEETAVYEYSTYLTTDDKVDEAFIEEGEDKNKGYKLNSFGELAYTLKEGVSVTFENGVVKEKQSTDTKNFTLITMSFTEIFKTELNLLPNSVVANIYKGKTNEIDSFVVVDRYKLTPVFTHKTAVTGAQDSDDFKSYTLIADYTGTITGKKEAKLKDSRGEFTLSIKDGTYYDSEMINYAIRGMRTVRATDSTSRTFSVASPYDNLLAKKSNLQSRDAKQSTAASFDDVKLSEDLYNVFDVTEKSESFNLKCFKTTLSLTDAKSGPSIELFYSSAKTVTNYNPGSFGTLYSASKVLVQSSYKNHDKDTNAVYLHEYILTDYSNKKL